MSVVAVAVRVTIVVVIVVIVMMSVTALFGIQEAYALGQISLLDATSALLAHYQKRYHENDDEQAGAAADQSNHGYAYTRYLDSSVQERLTPARIALGDGFWRA